MAFSQLEWPRVTASCSGVRPSHLIVRSAPWLRSTVTASARLPWTATCRGVAPVEERRLMSAAALTRMRMHLGLSAQQAAWSGELPRLERRSTVAPRLMSSEVQSACPLAHANASAELPGRG